MKKPIFHSSGYVAANRSGIVKITVLLALLQLVQSRGATVLDYTPPANSIPLYAASPGVPVSYASAFAVASDDVELTSISFRLDGRAVMSYDFTAYIFADAGDHPGVLIGASHRFFGPGQFTEQGLTFYEFALSNPLTLSAGKTYWAGLGTSSAGYPPYIAYTSHLEQFSGNGVTPSLSWCSTAYPPGGEWTVNAPDVTLVYVLQGSVIPEPGLGGFVALGMAMLVWRRKREM